MSIKAGLLLLLIIGILDQQMVQGKPQPLRRVARQMIQGFNQDSTSAADFSTSQDQDLTTQDQEFSTDQGFSTDQEFSTPQNQDSTSQNQDSTPQNPDSTSQNQDSTPQDQDSTTQDQDFSTDPDSSTTDLDNNQDSSSQDSTRQCPFGQIRAQSDQGNCYKVQCVTDRDCKLLFGANSTCDQDSDSCNCDLNHRLDEITQKCSKIYNGLQRSCNGNWDCDAIAHSECYDNQCRCTGYFMASDDGATCDRIASLEVYNDAQCEARYGVHSSWVVGLASCQCDDGYSQDDNSQCVLKSKGPSRIGNICSSDDVCGNEAYCLDSECKCPVGYIVASGGVDCKQYQCTDSYECSGKGFEHTKCEAGKCVCENGYNFDYATKKCKSEFRLLNSFCSSTSECGLNADCVYGICQCEANHKRSDSMSCKLASCSADYECSSADSNSVCSYGTCSCADGYYVDYASQTCMGSYFGGSMAASLGVVGAVSLISIIIAVITILIRASKQGNNNLNRGTVAARNAARARATVAVTSTAKISIPQKC